MNYFLNLEIRHFDYLISNFVKIQNTNTMQRLFATLLILFSSALGWCDEVFVPVDPDPQDPPPPHRRRSRPMMQWVTIDTDALTVTTTLTDPVITYYILDESGEVMLIAADVPEQFVADVATLPAGDYTIRLLTATDRSFSGPLTIN